MVQKSLNMTGSVRGHSLPSLHMAGEPRDKVRDEAASKLMAYVIIRAI